MTAKVRAFFSDCMPEHAATAQGVWQFTIALYHNTFKKVKKKRKKKRSVFHRLWGTNLQLCSKVSIHSSWAFSRLE